MKVHFSVHSKIIGMIINESQVYDDRTIISESDTLELAITDMKAQIEAITLENGSKLELISFFLMNIEA